MFRQDFQHDFEAITKSSEPFAFTRFGDGEHALLEGLPYRAASKWLSPGGKVWLHAGLEAALVERSMERYFVGISPPCCAPASTHFYREALQGFPKGRTTFATLFMARNYRRFKEVRAKFSDAIVVGCKKADILVPERGVTNPWDIDAVVTQLLNVERPIFVAAGPCANLIIHRYWQRQDPEKRQTILDIGAALDLHLHGENTRHYHKNTSKVHQHRCSWTDGAPGGPISRRARERAEKAQRSHRAMEQLQGTTAFVSGRRGRGSSRKVKRR